MKAGKIASLFLLMVLVGIAIALIAGSLWMPWLQDKPPAMTLAIVGGCLLGTFAAVLVPLGLAWDRSIGSVLRRIENAGDSEEQTIAVSGPTWLRPMARSFTAALSNFRQREQNLRNQLGELEIRNHVSEAERRQAEAVLHSLRDAVVVTNAFNEIVMVNTAAAELLGFDPDEAMHQSIDRHIDDERLCQLVRDTREHGNFAEVRHVEHELPKQSATAGDDEHSIYDVMLCCVENHLHEVGGVIVILHDVTHQRELSQMKSDFVSKASHELRTPLASIRGYVEMLIDGDMPDEESRSESYHIIHSEVNRMSRLIDNMLNISRIEAGIIQVERTDVDFTPLVQRAVESLEMQAREKKISLHAKMAAVDLCVQGDGDMLYQVVLNLMSNAVKYTPEGGRVTVAADTDNLTRCVVVTVSDTGLGIPPDALPRLFDKFYRVPNYARVAKGTGLGLNLCKHIVETVHHGQVGVESKLGMGSKFWFSIPMRYAGSQAAA